MMESQVFITVDDQHISLEKALKYIKGCGRWKSFLWEVVSQHVIEQEFQALEQWPEDALLTHQVIMEFCIRNQLTDLENFQDWLQDKDLDYSIFCAQIMSDFKIAHLKANVAGPRLQEYFIEQKLFLDQVILSRLAVNDQGLAEELKSQVLEDGVEFEQLVQKFSLEDRTLGGMLEPISRGTMPDKLRAAVDLAKPGEIIGPIELDELWFLIRIEQFLSAKLDETLQQKLEDELFEQWLEQKIQAKTVELQIT